MSSSTIINAIGPTDISYFAEKLYPVKELRRVINYVQNL